MSAPVDDQAAALREKPGEKWAIWFVPHALDGSYTWCARLHGDDIRNVVQADSAEHLDEHIRLGGGRPRRRCPAVRGRCPRPDGRARGDLSRPREACSANPHASRA